MCGHQPGEQGAARTLPTGGRGTGKIYGPYEALRQGPLVTKATMGVQSSSSRARTSDRRDAVVQARLYQEGQAVRVLKRYPNRCRRGHPKNHGLPGCPQCGKRLGGKAATWNLDPRRAVDPVPGDLPLNHEQDDGDRAPGRKLERTERSAASPPNLTGVATRLVRTQRPIDIQQTLRPMQRGRGDPTMRTEHGVAERVANTRRTGVRPVHGDRGRDRGRGMGSGRAVADRAGCRLVRCRGRRRRVRSGARAGAGPPAPSCGPADPADRSDHRTPDPRDPRAEGHRQRSSARVPATGDRPGRACSRPARPRATSGPRTRPRSPTTRSIHSASSAAAPRCSGMWVRERHGSMRRPRSRSRPPRIASRPCRGSDRGRSPRWPGSRSATRTPYRWAITTYPTSWPGARPRTARVGRADARAARALPPASRPRATAARDERDPRARARAADGGPRDRPDVSYAGCSLVQFGQRVASRAMSVLQNGQLVVVAAFGPLIRL